MNWREYRNGQNELNRLDRKLRALRSTGKKESNEYRVLESKRSEVFEAVEGYPEGHIF